jgi:pimeloyl-ACP methyl ester carboxylesterase
LALLAEVSMASGTITWSCAQQQITLGFDRLGEGPPLLLLPALSSISTRHELRGLQERLARRFATIAIDWPGFGDQPRLPVAWQPETYVQYLQHVLREIAPRPFATVAAGHAAGYALRAAADVPHATGRLCLIAPTWRGPLPTMMNGRRDLGERIARTAEWPIVGPLLYRLNVNRASLRMMARGHVYSDPNWLAGERLAQKMAVVTAAGAWPGSIRFVTGVLDPMRDSATFHDTAQRVQDPILVICGAATPPRSKAEMQGLARFAHVKLVELPAGKLAVHEEFPDAVAEQILAFAEID